MVDSDFSPEPGRAGTFVGTGKSPAVKPYRDALVADGIALAQFEVENVEAEVERLTHRGVRFTQPPTAVGPVTIAVFDDTCGNLIMIQSSSS